MPQGFENVDLIRSKSIDIILFFLVDDHICCKLWSLSQFFALSHFCLVPSEHLQFEIFTLFHFFSFCFSVVLYFLMLALLILPFTSLSFFLCSTSPVFPRRVFQSELSNLLFHSSAAHILFFLLLILLISDTVFFILNVIYLSWNFEGIFYFHFSCPYFLSLSIFTKLISYSWFICYDNASSDGKYCSAPSPPCPL